MYSGYWLWVFLRRFAVLNSSDQWLPSPLRKRWVILAVPANAFLSDGTAIEISRLKAASIFTGATASKIGTLTKGGPKRASDQFSFPAHRLNVPSSDRPSLRRDRPFALQRPLQRGWNCWQRRSPRA